MTEESGQHGHHERGDQGSTGYQFQVHSQDGSGRFGSYNWVSGPPMTEQERLQARLHETEPIRRFTQAPI